MILVTLRHESFTARIELVHDVEQGFVVHRLVLEDCVSGLSPHQPRNRRIFDRAELQRAQDGPVALRGKSRHGTPVGPVGPLVAPRVIERRGIDPAFEDVLQQRVERVLLQRPFVERQITKRRNVPFVKRKWVAQRDRAIVERIVVNQREKRGRTFSVFAVPVEQSRPVEAVLVIIASRASLVRARSKRTVP